MFQSSLKLCKRVFSKNNRAKMKKAKSTKLASKMLILKCLEEKALIVCMWHVDQEILRWLNTCLKQSK
jgi:hypothetical protein